MMLFDAPVSWRCVAFVGALVCASAIGAARAGVVYQSDFQAGVTAGWSTSQVFVDDNGKKVLGVFENASVTLTLGSLSPGSYEVAFDFYNINSWDGDGRFFPGPDRFTFALAGAPKIVAAFSNAARLEQTYSPSTPFGGGPFLGGTGAAGANELYIVRAASIPSFRYRWAFPFAHAGGSVVFTFTGSITQAGMSYLGFKDECWALDQVVVTQACPADLNGDGVVDDADFSIFIVAYDILDCSDASMAPGCPADLNKDGLVDDSDFSLFAAAYDALLCP